ncbi:Uncharacterised protein [Burkholderia pseudomallei]|nr:Uncharacterised protein [Burkholderia pseudomallei]CAJ7881399.1 Uncharacterised protein [Burkholderia pseudomallei]VBF68306.1 Uncharacterised protein [Burkholderia pseudomallei]
MPTATSAPVVAALSYGAYSPVPIVPSTQPAGNAGPAATRIASREIWPGPSEIRNSAGNAPMVWMLDIQRSFRR